MTYASLLAFYLYLRASTKYSARPELLREHPILKRLLTLKQSLTTLEDLGFNASDSDDDSGSDDLEDDESDESDEILAVQRCTRGYALNVELSAISVPAPVNHSLSHLNSRL